MKTLTKLAGLGCLLLSAPVFAAQCTTAQQHKGEALFTSECSVCHSVTVGGATKMGPNLKGLFGRTSGSLPGFSYSQAMKAKAVEWQMQSLEQFIASPQAFVAGTYMPYMGLANAEDRHAVACFLSTQK
ncbi:c-type cytochrome [Pseudomonas sihuiensis]|uniref:Cytochrome c n=1 Tax=Pseudomonas sihuiensis TaxID=1274359 RepID=A0A1H2MWK0_9PSED|nr:cytochrome c [Pseudomonas sihuiensis]